LKILKIIFSPALTKYAEQNSLEAACLHSQRLCGAADSCQFRGFKFVLQLAGAGPYCYGDGISARDRCAAGDDDIRRL
jgi:hypothetical protein